MLHIVTLIEIKAQAKLLNNALELGINLWDTADVYRTGENEKLILQVLKPYRDKTSLATKFGFTADSDGKLLSK